MTMQFVSEFVLYTSLHIKFSLSRCFTIIWSIHTHTGKEWHPYSSRECTITKCSNIDSQVNVTYVIK